MIDRQAIEGQIQALEEQRRRAEDDIKKIDGALQLARHWQADLAADEAQAKQAQEQALAETNGQAEEVFCSQ